MDGERKMDAYCEDCGEPTRHFQVDPGSCRCSVCGRVQQLMVPTEAGMLTLGHAIPELAA